MWHTAILAQWNPLFTFIPIESQIEKFQDDYYEAISKCHGVGNSDVFIKFMLEQIDQYLKELAAQAASADEQLNEPVKKMLALMEPGVPYTARAIMEKLSLKSRETFRKHYMNPALDLSLVHRTLPDKPQSRNQRYVKN
ncbi:hypothetical protein SAMN04515656_10931 [Eubacterium aggregans]|uniref:Filamentation induced by cAMP protein Fic-like C-terminal domain-containing protein n=1 Tax=Eubacterium aggregans TaxID=81409 RepID=A0A1H4ATL2_9FIRM|nr:hypothetical protein [Eubacterium aggregans]MDD4509216.1 hypothetical protein [Eubacteriaceae bacterium]SEA39107.1 hypothetical protein SAMN04515656_10931 [Eubacterium aggregans]